MTSKGRNVPAFRLAGLAFILVFSGVMPVIEQAEAQVNLSVLAGPYYVAGLPARGNCQASAVVLARAAGNETQVQSVQVLSGSSGSINQVHFIYDVVADPGSSTRPGLSKALLWNAELSGGAGWTASVDNGNDAATGELQFSGPAPGVSIPFGTVVKTRFGVEFATTQSGSLGPAQQATGKVTFTKNPSFNGTVTVPANTIVRTAGPNAIDFRTIQSVQWASGTRDVDVLAVAAGSRGNVAANTVTVMGQSVAGVLSVTNQQPMSRGQDPTARISAKAVYPGLEGNVPANQITVFRDNPPAGVTNVTNPQAMEGGKALTAGTRRILTFTADPSAALTAGPGAIFTFAFQIPRNAVGGETPDSYPVRISTTGPSNTDTQFCIRIDNTPPKILTAVTRDTDHDGRLDLVELTFDEALDKESLIHRQFQVKTKTAEKPYSILTTSPPLDAAPCGFNPPETVDPTRILQLGPVPDLGTGSGAVSTTPCPRRVLLRLAPGPQFDTGDLPDVTYPAPDQGMNLTDLAGNKFPALAVRGINTTDGAKPVLVSALAKDGSNRLVVTFSESVQGRGVVTGGKAPLRFDGPTCESNCLSDFTYKDCSWPKPPGNTSTIPCPQPQPTPNANGSNIGAGDCLGVPAPSGTGMPSQLIQMDHSVTSNPNQAVLHVGQGSAQYPDRYPKAWGTATTQGWVQPAPGSNGCNNGQFGAGDTHKTFGDRLGIALDQAPPPSCVNVQRKIWDFAPCDTVIKDDRGLRAVTYRNTQLRSNATVLISGVYVTEAEVNIASFRLTLKFNGPVESAQGAPGQHLGIQVTDLDVVSADDSGQGPGGILAINHTAGSDMAVLTLDHPTRPTDVDDTPARIRLSCATGRGVRAFGLSGVFVPCGDPDADNRPDVGMVDRTPPAFTGRGAIPALSTVDANRNGYIDGIKVYFSEPIDDSSFCGGPQMINGVLPPVKCMGDGFFDEGCDQPNTHSVLIVHNIPGPYTWDTDLLPDDDQGIIRFPETPGHLQTTGYIPAISTNPCWTSDTGADQYRTDFNCGAGANTNPPPFCGSRRGTGLFADQFHLKPSNPPFQNANLMKRVCGEAFGGGTQKDIPPCVVGGGESGGITSKVFDGAPPVLWSAKTIDTPRVTSTCNNSISGGCEGNGMIDGYVLAFSEPVNDCSFRAPEWKVARHNVTGMRTNTLLSAYNALCPAPRYPPQGQGDDRIVLVFDEWRDPDTDQKPELTYAGPSCPSCGLRDLKGNAMPAFGSLAVTEQDDAPPVIFCVRGFVGRDEVTVEFSEGVDNGDRGALTRSDFVYANGNPEDVGGASGMSGTVTVEHQPGSRFAIITLNAPLAGRDFTRDTLSAFPQGILEVSPTVTVKKTVSTVPHGFCRGIDDVAPGAVENLQVVAGLTSANSVTLSWLAPGNDDTSVTGEANGNVTGYRIKVSKEPITGADFDFTSGAGHVALMQTTHERDPATCLAANGTQILNCLPECRAEMQFAAPNVNFDRLILRLTPTPCALALPGNVQRATIIGLDPDTEYHFGVVAFDNATDRDGNADPNVGPFLGEVVAVTARDETPPAPAPVIYTNGIPPYRAQFNRRPTFFWTNATDPESQVIYAYALKPGDSEYIVSCGADDKTLDTKYTPSRDLPDGLHTLYVAACSAGDATPTAHYTIRVGPDVVDPTAIRGANNYVLTRPYRLDELYIVNWTLPAEGEIARLVPGGELEAVDIYRLWCYHPDKEPGSCVRELAQTIRGDYEELRTGEWTDDNVTAPQDPEPYYRVEMVFAKGQRQDTASTVIRDFAPPADRTPREPVFPWLLGAILLALALAALVAWAIVASRRSAALRQAKEEAPAGVDPETGLPTHDVKCPTCSTPFQAVGTLPLQITCPNCGASGLLQ